MMETHKGKSVLQEFQTEGSWVPVTPAKPNLSQSNLIYDNGHGGLLGQPWRGTEDFFTSHTPQNQAQTLLTYSIGPESYSQPTTSNNMWGAAHETPSLSGRMHVERENGNIQRRGLEDCIPHWSSQGKRSVATHVTTTVASSGYPNFSPWREERVPWTNNVVRQIGSTSEQIHSADLLDNYNSVSFGALLGVGDTGNAGVSIPNWMSQAQAQVNRFNYGTTFSNQDALREMIQQNNGNFQQEFQNGALSRPYWSVSNVDTPVSTKHANGKDSTFAPATPDSRQRIENTVGPGNTNSGTNRGPEEQTMLPEHEVAAVMINLQDHQNKEVQVPTTDLSHGEVCMEAEENQNPDKEGNQAIDLNKTPQKKTRRRRYQPKVVKENKPKRTPKPKTPKPTDSKEIQVKRKYVRKTKLNTPSTISPREPAEIDEPKPTEASAKSCRKSLNFDLNGEMTEQNSPNVPNGGSDADPLANECYKSRDQFSHPVHLSQEEEFRSSMAGTAYDLNRSLNQELREYMSLPESLDLNSSQPDMNMSSKPRKEAASRLSRSKAQLSSKEDYLAKSPNSSPCASSNEGVQTRGSKRSLSYMNDPTGVAADNVAATRSVFWQDENADRLPQVFIPEICKKKRTEKVQRSHASSTSSSAAASEDISQVAKNQYDPRVDLTSSKYYHCNPAHFRASAVTNNQPKVLTGSSKNNYQLLNNWPDIDRLNKKRRSKGTTRVRDLAPLSGIAEAALNSRTKKLDDVSKPNSCTAAMISVHSCTEVVRVDTKAATTSNRRSRIHNSTQNSLELVPYDGNQSTRKAPGSTRSLRRPGPCTVEGITEKMEQLDMNKGQRRRSNNKRGQRKISHRDQTAIVPYKQYKQEHNSIVPYGKDGTIVPFEGPFNPIRKRRQRAKVDLDDETTRVWRLLLENINNQGIDGTDKDKAKWWENERRVFRGRVDSFIARMRLVQGDRRFTPWKGSVLDSVIGVFLTQNVSDHLSSSAFMSMAARFPFKRQSNSSTLYEETSGLVEDPEVCIMEPEESITWNEKTADQPTLDRNSRVTQDTDHSEEKEDVNSKEIIGKACPLSPSEYFGETCQQNPNDLRANNVTSQTTETETASILGDDKARDDATSSQQSVISSQNSINSPSQQPVGMMNIFSESNSRTQATSCNYNNSYSFMKLLRMAETSHQELCSQTHMHHQLDGMKHVTGSSPETPGVSSSDYQFNLKTDLHLHEAKGLEMLEVESRSPDMSRKDENSPTTEQSNLTTESTNQEKSPDSFYGAQQNICSYYILEGEDMVKQSQIQSVKDSVDTIASSVRTGTSRSCKDINVSNSFWETVDVVESTAAMKRTENHNAVEKMSDHLYASGGSDIANTTPNKTGKAKVGKGKRNEFDWDSLRREAQVNGQKKERTANRRDSLDWEAVRHTDVKVIAETIKERGMNNMLAERIKDLLDRLVKDHGSIDLEWLRDIPPDKAKEYLLSFRGLGLKSVECVRLLTLHHLAFPVDTNVGRIAVRLGWVPLQPLPESLQLHLLEMYPILESIQKYLWPRLCKLDQKTLYELHYHMITFGKVFCTKRQPNCNACPLRGECRHFASAFASARFALPGPEERSIMPSNGTTAAYPSPKASINLLPSTASWNSIQNEAPTSQVSSSTLSLQLNQTIHLERRSINSKCEPIVEVPASPEPEPQQEQELSDMEDTLLEDPNEIPTIKLNMEEFTQTIQSIIHANGDLQEAEVSNALVALTAEAASIPTPKLKNISRLRTEHHVYELPDTHQLLQGMDNREPDDPCSYLLAIWTPGETADSIEPPARKCISDDPSILCNEETCLYCNSRREADSEIVRGTLLIPCRTAMRGSFPLNGTYFQVNEVFADHDSSLNPIAVPRSWLWNLPRRTVYFGTSIPTIFRGMSTEDIQHCFWRGYVCVRGFDQKTRGPRPLMARLHFPASRMTRGAKGKAYDE